MAKLTKSKEELEGLIMQEISKQPVCPLGMGVSIQAIGGGGWEAYAVPPVGNIAYADCADLIARVASALREQYDLSEVPPPGTYAGDDTASYVAVRAHLDRQRRNVAATSAGTTEPVNLARPSS